MAECVYIVGVLVLVLGVALLLQARPREKQGLCTSQSQLPALTPQKDVVQQALFPVTPPTWNSGMQWSFSWRFKQPNKGTIVFDTTLDQGLMVGVSSAMSDTGGGYIVHILAPDKDNVTALYGVSDMLTPGVINAFASEPISAEPPRRRRYSVTYDHGRFKLEGEQGVLFDVPYPFSNQMSNAPQQNINYFGFGTSSVGAPRSIDSVNIY